MKAKNTQVLGGEVHWKKVAKAFMPSDTPEQKLAIFRLHAAACVGSRG